MIPSRGATIEIVVGLPMHSAFSRFIGVGRTDWFRLPLPPNRTGGFSASRSPVGGFSSERIDRLAPGQMLTRTTRAPQSRHLAHSYNPGPFPARHSLFRVARCLRVSS